MSSDLRTNPHTTGTMTTTGTATGGARTMTIIGFVCAAISLLFLPIVFGPAAIVLGIVAYKKGDRLGMWAAVAGAAGLVIGMVLGMLVFAANNNAGTAG